MLARIRQYLADSLFPTYSARRRLSYRYLQGEGLEIGALHHPLEVPPGVIVRYVDCASREENIARYKGIDVSGIVVTDHVTDGFILPDIAPCSQDFVIANHLLEHTPNPVQALLNWHRVLKSGGILFLTLPDALKSFDYGRAVTPVEHMVVDYELVRDDEQDEFGNLNRQHLAEFVDISIPNLHQVHRNLKTYRSKAEKEAYIQKLEGENAGDAHYHVFSQASFKDLLQHLQESLVPDLYLLELATSRGGKEFIAIIRKEDNPGS